MEAFAADDDATWAYAWPAGRRMTDDLAAIVDCRNMRIADLGCGLGGLGRAALRLGATQVTFADRSPGALAKVQAVIDGEGLASQANCALHEWGQPIPGAPFPLILGGDILYRPVYFSRLLTSIALSLDANGRCLLSDPRQQLDEELPALAQAAGLSWNILLTRPTWLTVVELRPICFQRTR